MNQKCLAITLTLCALVSAVGNNRVQAGIVGLVNVPDALEFVIPKSMEKELSAIQWTLKAETKGSPILNGNHYQLVNMFLGRGLKAQKRSQGANLGFHKNLSNRLNLIVKSHTKAAHIRYGDVVALKLEPYGWLHYKNQGEWAGINLGGGDNGPHYVWQIRGGRPGTKLLSGMPFALHNLNPMKTEIVYCPRNTGINLGWHKNPRCRPLFKMAYKQERRKICSSVAVVRDCLLKRNLCRVAVDATTAFATMRANEPVAAVRAAASRAIENCRARWAFPA